MGFKKISKKIIQDVCCVSSKIGKKSINALDEGKNYIVKTSENVGNRTKKITIKAYSDIRNTKDNVSKKTTAMCSKLTGVVCISDELLERKVSNKLVIFSLLVFSWILFHAFYSFTRYLSEISYWNIFGIMSAIVGSIVMGWLGWITFCDICGIITIHKQNEFRRNTNKLIKEKNIQGLKEYLLTYPTLTIKNKEKLKNEWEKVTKLEDILEIYTENTLKKTDKEIKKIIKQYATYSAGLNAVSKKAWFDFVITMYFYSKIIIEIAHVYRIKIGICSFLKLMMFGLLGSSISSLIQKIATESTKNLPFVNILTEAAVNGSLVYVLGSQVQSIIRPVKENI